MLTSVYCIHAHIYLLQFSAFVSDELSDAIMKSKASYAF